MGKPLSNMLKILDMFKAVNRELPLQQIELIFKVAERPGINMIELVKATGMSQGALSRNIMALSKYRKVDPITGEKSDDGYGLLYKMPDIDNPRSLAIHLTPKGEELVKSILSLV